MSEAAVRGARLDLWALAFWSSRVLSQQRSRPVGIDVGGVKRQASQTNFSSEGFDPGSERTLAAWIRHASRTNPSGGNSAGGSGERGSNAWITYPRDGDSPSNEGVIPGDSVGRHLLAGK